jgi:hypothetical protein
MKAVLFGRFKQGLTSGSYSQATMIVTSSQLAFDVGMIFRSRFEFTPEEVRRFHKTDEGLRIYHSKAGYISPVIFRVTLFRSQNLALRTIKRAGFVPRGRISFNAASQDAIAE